LAVAQPRISIIFVSAHGDEVAQARALRMGALAFLYKPFSQEALLNHVRQALQVQSPRSLGASARFML
jgi:FixJ family two-component response regulator